MVGLANDGTLTYYPKKHLDLIETFSVIYQQEERKVRRAFISGAFSDDECDEELERFYKTIQSLRLQLRLGRDKTPGSAPPIEFLQAITDLRSTPPRP